MFERIYLDDQKLIFQKKFNGSVGMSGFNLVKVTCHSDHSEECHLKFPVTPVFNSRHEYPYNILVLAAIYTPKPQELFRTMKNQEGKFTSRL